MIRLALFDIEGTLTNGNGRGHSPDLLPALTGLMEKDVKVGLVTGRDAYTAQSVNRIFDLNGPILAENGSLLVPDFKHDEDHRINYGGINYAIKREVRKALDSEGILDLMFCDNDKRYMVTLYPNGFPYDYDSKSLPKLCKKVDEILKPVGDFDVSYSSAAVDITAKGVNKGSSIRRYCNGEGYSMDEVAFAGDSANDLPAFREVGSSGGLICVVNNSEMLEQELKKFKRLYTKAKGSEGSVSFIRYILNHVNNTNHDSSFNNFINQTELNPNR